MFGGSVLKQNIPPKKDPVNPSVAAEKSKKEADERARRHAVEAVDKAKA